jgi:hypothetical protein
MIQLKNPNIYFSNERNKYRLRLKKSDGKILRKDFKTKDEA